MKKRRVGLVLTGLILTACAHHHPVDTPSTAGAATSDAAYTGLPPSYPRATPVTAPPASPKPVPQSVAASSPPPVAPIPDTTAPVSSPVPAPMDSTPAPVTTPPPAATTPETPADSTPMDTTPASPAIAIPPPRPMSENEAKRQVVVLKTSLGEMVVELDDIAAPRTCGNFRKLVAEGFYNHTVFHRVIPKFMIQGGDPNSKADDRRAYGLGDPGYTLPAEIHLKAVAGAVAMARLPDATNPQRDSNGSQFFICVADCPSIDDQYTVFGHVIRGLDTAVKIANQQRDNHDDPVERIEMQASLESKQQALAENPR